jgi:murein DD-endopeptidase MepM/ murein hydrolase activator NlpD
MTLALCAVALLLSIVGAPDARALTPLGSQISSGRRSQAYFESVMLAQDAAIRRIKAQSKVTRKALKQARKSVKRTRGVLRSRIAVERDRQARLEELEALHADTAPEEIPEQYFDRLRSARRSVGKAHRQRKAAARQHRIARRIERARRHRLGALKRQRRAAVARRESAEGGLGAYIVRMTRLAQQRAELVSGARLAVGGTPFTWPAVGRLAQTYGCTGFRLNPPRGSCRHFHDGLDIVAGYGSPVRTAADGVIAYAGWNPWDEGGRAWIMVVSHPDGFVTRYGHLVPGGRARVGQFVRQGQSIGRMGNTGKSTGTHLHFELLRGSTPLSPWAYLPEGMVVPKVKRSPDRKAGKQSQRRHKAGKGKRAKRAAERRRKARAAERRAASRRDASGAPVSLEQVTDEATALFESSFDEATVLVCEVIARSRGTEGPATSESESGGVDGDQASDATDAARGADPNAEPEADPCAALEADVTDGEAATSGAQGPPVALRARVTGAAQSPYRLLGQRPT